MSPMHYVEMGDDGHKDLDEDICIAESETWLTSIRAIHYAFQVP